MKYRSGIKIYDDWDNILAHHLVESEISEQNAEDELADLDAYKTVKEVEGYAWHSSYTYPVTPENWKAEPCFTEENHKDYWECECQFNSIREIKKGEPYNFCGRCL
tara:strand:+ start:242 stop:559 length:318 start_codon:yes stop_codon:yes gene_type:complete